MQSRAAIITVLIVAIIIGGVFYWRSANVVVDPSRALNKAFLSLFVKYGLIDSAMIKKSVEEKKRGTRRYVSTFREYNVPSKFSFDAFDVSLREKVKLTGFRISKHDQATVKDIAYSRYTITYKGFDALILKMNKKDLQAFPRGVKRFDHPKVAIVIDDFGYAMANVEPFLDIKQPLTFSILPNLTHSKEIAETARSRGYEVILHLPLEPHNKEIKEEIDTIRSSMSAKEVVRRLGEEMASVPGLNGVSNHMGSKSTEEKALMTVILKALKEKKLYFLDSLTSEKSVCKAVASELGTRFARRDIFLDNSNDPEAIKKQMLALRNFAFKNGRAVAICHDRKNTVKVLSEMVPQLTQEGVRFVFLSELVS